MSADGQPEQVLPGLPPIPLQRQLRQLGDTAANLQVQLAGTTPKLRAADEALFRQVILSGLESPAPETIETSLIRTAGDLRGCAIALEELADIIARRTAAIIDKYSQATVGEATTQ